MIYEEDNNWWADKWEDEADEDDDMAYHDDDNYDDYEDFYSEYDDGDDDDDSYDEGQSGGWEDVMDGDFDSSMRDAGYGTDEDYGYYGEDY